MEITEEMWADEHRRILVFIDGSEDYYPLDHDKNKKIASLMKDEYLEWCYQNHLNNPDKWWLPFIEAVKNELAERSEKIVLNKDS